MNGCYQGVSYANHIQFFFSFQTKCSWCKLSPSGNRQGKIYMRQIRMVEWDKSEQPICECAVF